MHDPMIVAHEIKYPWFQKRPWPKKYRDREGFDKKHIWKSRMTEEERRGRDSFWDDGYRKTFITIWHVDPEKDGSDDSCGYSYVKLTRKQRNILRNTAWSEGYDPHFLICAAKKWSGNHADAESLYRGLFLLVARVLKLSMTFDEAAKYASEWMHIRTGGHYGDSFCFLPGYHSNRQTDSKDDRQEHFTEILCSVARTILTDRRPWWKHPKWHFWHWKFQCHPLLDFKRWAFSRCSKCGGRFSWGYAPCTNSWNGTGPLWFRSERDTYHSDCNRPTDSCQKSAEPTVQSDSN